MMSKSKTLTAEQSLDERQAAKTALKNFRILFSAVKTHFSMIQQSCEISGAQLWALHETHLHEGITVGALAEKLSIKPATASSRGANAYSPRQVAIRHMSHAH